VVVSADTIEVRERAHAGAVVNVRSLRRVKAIRSTSVTFLPARVSNAAVERDGLDDMG
jgi:hypothetical protein